MPNQVVASTHISGQRVPSAGRLVNPRGTSMFVDDGTEDCSARLALPATRRCKLLGYQRHTIYPSKNESGRLILTNE